MKLNSTIATLLIVISTHYALIAQVVSADPAFPLASQSVSITFNASEGSGGLEDYEGDVYAHTGVITNASTSPSDWKQVRTAWGENTPATRLERLSANRYRLNISPSIAEYYDVAPAEVLQIAVVFRSAEPVNGGYLEGKTADGGDIFIDVQQDASMFNVAFVEPAIPTLFRNVNDVVNLRVRSSRFADVRVYDNGVLWQSTQAMNYSNIFPVRNTDGHTIRIEVESDGEVMTSEYEIIVNKESPIAALPDGASYGTTFLGNNAYRFVLEAPDKDFIYLLSNLNDFQIQDEYLLNKTPDGDFFWIDLDAQSIAGEDVLYQFLVDGEILIADPQSQMILDQGNDGFVPDHVKEQLPAYPEAGNGEPVSVILADEFNYSWTSDDYVRPDKEELVIYELLIRDFLESHTYLDLIDTLDYLERLGINAIELMPINEFSGNLSWGYNPTYHGAVDKYYGTPQDLKQFVDACHNRGMAVILDVVYNQAHELNPLARMYWNSRSFRPSDDSPFLNANATHPFNVFFDFNHESEGTQRYMDVINLRWIQEYRIDGFRFDLSKGFTQTDYGSNVGAWSRYDQGRINILKRLADVIWDVDPENYVILEHFAANDEEIELSNYGMMLWGNMNHNYNDATMGFTENGKSNLEGALSDARGWDDRHLISYMESHDEERLVVRNEKFGNSNDNYNTQDFDVAIDRIKGATAFFYTLPGPKMLWQFGEVGYDFSINYCPDGSERESCRVDNKPIRWDYARDDKRLELYDVTRDIIYLREISDAIHEGELTYDLRDAVKSINIQHDDLDIIVLGNFLLVESAVTAETARPGTYYNYLTGDSLTFNVNTTSAPILQAGEFMVLTSRKITPPSQGGVITSTEEIIDQEHIAMYPVPVHGRPLYLNIDGDVEIMNATLLNIEGKAIQNLSFNRSGSQLLLEGFSQVEEGMYILQLETDKGILTTKVLN